MSAPTLSVVVPTYQRRVHLERALRAFAAQTVPPDAFEVIVSVDGSTDGTTEMLRAITVPYRLVALERPNQGRARAINAGLAAARGELVVLLDDDMEPAPAFLEAHRARHDGQPALGVLGAVPVRVDPAAPPSTRYVGEVFNRHLANLARADYRWLLVDFYSGNFSVRRDVLERVGGFDESFTRYGNEDLELSVRLRRAGVTIVYSPAALAWQTNDKRFAELARDKREEGRTAVQFATMHPEVFPNLRLAWFGDAPAPNRALRAALLALARRWPAMPDLVVRVEALLSRHDPPGLALLDPQALGFFYWLGARDALVAQPQAVDRCPPLRTLARALGA